MMATEFKSAKTLRRAGDSRASERGTKKPYRSPELADWGSVTEITQGTDFGLQDFPGGTQPT